MEQGTITWISVEETERLPPIGSDALSINCQWSITVLLYHRPTGNVTTGFYAYGLEGFSHGAGKWQPTHFAYINLPPTSQ